MLINYIKIAARGLSRQRGYTIINVFGLSCAMTVALLMMLWIQSERSVDQFHKNKDRIYRVQRTIPLEGNELFVANGIPLPVLQTSQENLPEVEKYIPLGHPFDETLIYESSTLRKTGTFANSDFFEAFSFPILKGDISALNSKLDAAAISKSTAQALFGEAWSSVALGKTIEIFDNGIFTIEAIYENFPENSQLAYDFVYSFQHHLKDNEWMLEWTNSGMQGAILLQEQADLETVAKKIETLFHDNQAKERKEGIILQRFDEHYLYSNYDNQAQISGGRIEYVRLFSFAVLFLLIISCINFINLATARASDRAKEIGIRKTIGAPTKSIMLQYITEAAVLTFFSMTLAIMIAQLLLPSVRTIVGKDLHFDFSSLQFYIAITVFFIVTTLLSGTYPAFFLSRLRPEIIFKQQKTFGSKNAISRQALVTSQFILSVILIIGAIVVKQQVEYIQNKDLGLNKEDIIEISKDSLLSDKYASLKNELLQHPEIADVTLAGPNPMDLGASTAAVEWPAKRPDQVNQDFYIMWVESNFLDFFEIPLSDGRFYRKGQIDTTTIVLNEKAIEVMGLDNPVGTTIQWWGQPRQIIGVVKDFHNRSLYDEIKPTGILMDQEGTWSMYVRTKPNQSEAAIASVQSVFSNQLPDQPLHYEFIDNQYTMQYRAESLTTLLANYFAMIAIIISCLGLIGLTTFYIQQKTKEIGIRKVLGASVRSLVLLLSKDFLTIIIIAVVIAIPISIQILKQWINQFAYHIDFKPVVFLIATILSLAVPIIIIGLQTTLAALANPTKTLKNE